MCNIIQNDNGVLVYASNGNPSNLYKSLLQIPFLSDKQALSIYTQATSVEFLNNNLQLDENLEPKIFFARNDGFSYKLFDSIQEASDNSINGQVEVVFSTEKNYTELNGNKFTTSIVNVATIFNTSIVDNTTTETQNVIMGVLNGVLLKDSLVIDTRKTNNTYLVNSDENSELVQYLKISPTAMADFTIISGDTQVICK